MLGNVLCMTKGQILMRFYLMVLPSYLIDWLFQAEVIRPQQREQLYVLVPRHWCDFVVA